MVKRTYECDLCKKTDDVNADQFYIIGLYFAGVKIQKQVLQFTETHICRDCIKGIVALAATLDPKWLEGK